MIKKLLAKLKSKKRNYIKNDWSVIADPETALLKALVFQMEGK